MRRTLLATLLALGLLLTPIAAADGRNGHDARGQTEASTHRANETQRNDTSENKTLTNETSDDHARGNGHGNRGTNVAFVEAWHAFMDSWRENATKVIDSCHAQAQPGDNATHADRVSWAHCIRDGFKQLFEQLKTQRNDMRAVKHSD
ncbi:MAG: hypothetical protein WDA16_06810 [Candidatus Thermoplasmatota archaeon]